mmetsp:Transcript_25963/g.47455  ORF Transcript_25963/g.47455 Transcript_25963/m.47455 type:complete len:488 (+) Transcript_25963:97-1560(+)
MFNVFGIGLETWLACYVGVAAVLLAMHERGTKRRSLVVIVLCFILGVFTVYEYAQFQLVATCLDTVKEAANLPEGAIEREGCNDVTQRDGQLVLLSCTVNKNSLEPLHAWGPFANSSVHGVGLRARVEMMQCVEKGRGRTSRVHVIDWADHPVDMNTFKFKKEAVEACGIEKNPPWPDEVPTAPERRESKNFSVGGFTSQLPLSIKLNSHVTWQPPPEGWMLAEDTSVSVQEDAGKAYLYTKAEVLEHSVGQIRMTWYANQRGEERQPATTSVFLVGMNNGGTIERWQAPWPCSGAYSQGHFEVGSHEVPNEFREWHPRDSFPDFVEMFLRGLDVGLAHNAYDISNDVVTLAFDGVTVWCARLVLLSVLWIVCQRNAVLLGLTSEEGPDSGSGWALVAGAVASLFLLIILVVGIHTLPRHNLIGCMLVAPVLPCLTCVAVCAFARVWRSPAALWVPYTQRKEEYRQNLLDEDGVRKAKSSTSEGSFV